MTDIGHRLGGRPVGVALVTTPAGGWLLDWDPQLATFSAAHVTGTDPDGVARFDHELGTTRAAYPSPGALEEALGFALPSPVRSTLDAQRHNNPALAAPRGLDLGVEELPAGLRDLNTYPLWASQATAAGPDGGSSVVWGLALEQDRQHHAAVAELGQGTVLEVLGAKPEPSTGSLLVSYRLSHRGRVVVAGDDVRAPAGADLAADDSVRALLAVIVDANPSRRGRPLGAAAKGFLEAHRDRLLDTAANPPAPYPERTRVAVDVDGQRHLGRVAYPILSRTGEPIAYAWTPDVASLIGHPWRSGRSDQDEPERALIIPAANITASLARPEIGAPPDGAVLCFGAVVVAAHPTSGERIEATVLRAFAADHDVIYQVQPHTLDNTETLTLGGDQIALVSGTWWPTPAELMAARQTAGLNVVPGEILPNGSNDSGPPAVLTQETTESPESVPAPPEITPDQRAAALLVGLEPTPTTITIDILGELARVGDPDHGWMVMPADRLIDAMTKPAEQLHAIVTTQAPNLTLTGHESVPTLAALAARHAPNDPQPSTPTAAAPRPTRHVSVIHDHQAGL